MEHNKIYILSILLLSLCSCNNKKYNTRNYTVYISNGEGFNLSTCYIYVDSATAITPKSAVFWIDGRKSTVYADRIMIGN